MSQRRVRREDHGPAGLADPQAVVDVVERDGQLDLVEPAEVEEQVAVRQQAGAGDRGELVGQDESAEVAGPDQGANCLLSRRLASDLSPEGALRLSPTAPRRYRAP